MAPEGLLDVHDVAAILRVHKNSVYEWVKAGLLPSVSINARVRFERQAIKEFIEAGKIRLIDPGALIQKVSLPLDSYDKLHLKGGRSAVNNQPRRSWNYGFGSVLLRKTKEGRDRWSTDFSRRGRRFRKVVKDALTRGDAVVALQRRVAESFNGTYAPERTAGNLTFNDFANRFINEYAKREKKSWQTDEYRLRRLRESLGNLKMSAVTESKVLEFRTTMRVDGYSDLTSNRYLALLKTMFNWGVAKKLLAANPVKGIKKFSEKDTARDRVLSAGEEKKLFAELTPRIRLFVLFLLHTGLRYREALSLPWANVDLIRRRVKVEKTKGKRARFIPINSVMLDVLTKLRDTKKGPEVFPFKSVRTGFENACKRAGIDDLTFHDLRRTFGTRLLERGVDIVTISKLYGHSSVLVTQNYLHPSDELSVEAVEKLAENVNSREILSRHCHAESSKGVEAQQSSELLVS